MSFYIQYHNYTRMGRIPLRPDGWLATRLGFFTRVPAVKRAVGGINFLIVGLRSPKRYFLWEAVTIESVEEEDGEFRVAGPGWILLPPQELQGPEFETFRASCANFVGFWCIDDLSYLFTLRQLAERYHLGHLNQECEQFCTDLLEWLPEDGDVYYFRGLVRHQLGSPQAAREDFQKALGLDSNYRDRAKAWLEGERAAEQEATSEGATESDHPHSDLPAAVWQAIKERRGQAEFRRRLLHAYGYRCAITGCDAVAALEAAHLDRYADTGSQHISNGILLRADIHTLFDLGLIRIEPETLRVTLAPKLGHTSYQDLAGREVRLPAAAVDRPSRAALWRRYQAN